MTASTTATSGGLTRRTALYGVVALGVTVSGCTSPGPSRESGPDAPVRADDADSDVALASETLAGEELMLSRIQATAQRHHKLRPRLGPSMDVHAAHARLLREAAPDVPHESTSPDPTLVHTEKVSPNSDRAMRRLSLQEDRLSLTNRQSAFTAKSGDFARVLAGMAAAAAQQAVDFDQRTRATSR